MSNRIVAAIQIMQRSPRHTTILHLCSFLVVLYSLSMPIPIVIGLIFGEKNLTSFLATFVVAFSVGMAGWMGTRGGEKTLQTRDGFLVAVLFWLIFSVISTMPLYFDSRLGLTLVDAVFEGISGITTTGASVLDDIDNLPKSILYYRAQLNFLGGLGIIVLAVAVMPFLGIGGAKLYQSEMPGPLKEEKFTPRLADTAKHLWMIYTGLAFACGVSFFLAGMDWFDALCHSLSTVSLGGFSTHGSSLGFYNSPQIELVGGVYSILAAVNFSLYFMAINRRSFLPILNNSEFRFFILILSLVVGVTCIELYRTGTFQAQDAMVHGFFQAVSIMTDNGLGAGDYPSWPAHVVLLLLGASFFGGCVGSTCGGIKAMRFLLLYRQGSREIKQLIHPSAILATKVGGHSVSDRVIRSVWGLFFLYIFFACVFVWGLVALGHDLVTAFGTVAACMNNMGVGYGETAAGFGTLKDPAKWLMCVAMLFGRLEIFPILIVFSRTFWRF
nr:TrkH family potassium uptake protein [Pseudomonas benzenivorans]